MTNQGLYAVFQMAPSPDGERKQGYAVYKGDYDGALRHLRMELSKNPTWENVYLLVKVIEFHADISVSVTIQAQL